MKGLFLSIPIFFLIVSNCLANVNKIDMELLVSIDLNAQKISGTARTSSTFLDRIKISGINVIEIFDENGNKIPFEVSHNRIKIEEQPCGDTPVSIAFEKKIKGTLVNNFKEFFGGNFSNKNFMLLTQDWCPRISGLNTYQLTVKIPQDLTAISEANQIIESPKKKGEKEITFIFPFKREDIDLVIGKFFVDKIHFRNISLETYLLTKDKGLSKRLLDSLKKSVSLYEKLIGPYPYKRFSVIENELSSGLSLPTMTLIGKSIIGLPFITKQSLPHEFLHSWFGNSVYVDYESGNWCEGLTSYLSDYYLKELSGNGKEARHEILTDYQSYVTDKNGFPLSKFRIRQDRVSKAIGYGKASMIFHMLRKYTGDEKFFKALNEFFKEFKFKKASWNDIGDIFERVTSKKLDWFLDEWVERSDIPNLFVKEAIFSRKREVGYELNLTLGQKNTPVYQVTVPIRIFTKNKKLDHLLFLDKKEKNYSIWLPERPLYASIDPDFHLMRELSPSEFPPSLSRLFGTKLAYIVFPEKNELDKYRPLISFFQQKGFKTIKRKELKHSFLKDKSFLILGKTSGRLKALSGKLEPPQNGFKIKVKRSPFNDYSVIAHCISSSQVETSKAIFKLTHYGKYSYLFFQDGRLIEKKKAAYENGIYVELKSGLSGIFSTDIKTNWQILERLRNQKVVYLGEKHDEMGIHKAQLEIIKDLSESNKLAVGMEMFQRPFQEVINDYLNNKIDEKDFLKKAEYFKRWGFNYKFYRGIIEFCKRNGIPVIALNLPKEISKKIARHGISSLNKSERAALPRELDFSNIPYKRLLKSIYENHKEEGLSDFKNFYEAQIAWDETMAESISDYLIKNPDRQMIVIVGGGHVEYGFGIPERVKRRLPYISQSICLFNQGGELDPVRADLFLSVPRIKEPFSAKLGVLLTGEKKLTVEKIMPNSPAKDAGIKVGDVILAVDGNKVKDIYDLKVELFFKKEGEKAKITVKRKDKKGEETVIQLETGPFRKIDWSSMRMGRFHSK